MRLLHLTCRLWGIQPSYYNPQGQVVWSDREGLIRGIEVLSGSSAITDENLKQLCHDRDFENLSMGVSPSLTFWEGESFLINLYLDAPETKAPIEIYIENSPQPLIQISDPEPLSQKHRKGRFHLQIRKLWKDIGLVPGYYHVTIQTRYRELRTFWVIAPSRMPQNCEKSWGIFAPLYALKTKKDWGIGSLSDLKQLQDFSAQHGAGWIGTLPLLACDYERTPLDPSPYSSLTRLFWNEIYLDPTFLAIEASHTEALELIQSSEFQKDLSQLREQRYVPYLKVYEQKSKILKLLSAEFFAKKRNFEKDYLEFEKRNPEISRYCEFRSPLKDQQNFHAYCQFQVERQLKILNSHSDVGLYLDYPVGVSEKGFDFSEYRNVFEAELQAGAPPEPMYPWGQNWCFPTMNIRELRKSHYHYFRRTLESHMRFSKILRIDHIMGFLRMYAIPKGLSGKQGFYLRYGQEELFAICALEAQRNQVQIIGENLGTVPRKVNEIMEKRQMNGMWVYYMDVSHPNPTEAIDRISPHTLIGVNTHDMPTFASYLRGRDLELAVQLGNLQNDQRWHEDYWRRQSLIRWQSFLQSFHAVDLDTSDEGLRSYYLALLTKLRSSSALYLIFNPEDLWLEMDPQNVPGTERTENWSRRFLFEIENWIQVPGLVSAIQILNQKII